MARERWDEIEQRKKRTTRDGGGWRRENEAFGR